MGAIEYVDERLAQLDEVAAALKVRPSAVADRVEQLQQDLRTANHKLEAALTGAGSNQVAEALKSAVQLNGYSCVIAKLEGPFW